MIWNPRKGGTVVPPCDFHPLSLETPLNTGAPTIILSGARPPPRAARVRMQPIMMLREEYNRIVTSKKIQKHGKR